MRTVIAALIFLALCTAAWAAENPWAAMTARDLQAVHDLLEANHPGPVDPQNPQFRVWLEEGLKKAMARAQTAHSFGDYQRTLRFYTNGFEDGHIGLHFDYQPERLSWPGFVIGATSANDAEVISAEPDAGVVKGARLISCDGKTVDALLAARSDPYFWNAAVPHERYRWIEKLFVADPHDDLPKIGNCIFSSGAVSLNWRSGDAAQVRSAIEDADGTPKLGLRQIDGVWLVSIPTFDFESDADVSKIQTFIAELKAKAPALRNSTVVMDVRGNTGGSSGWGQQVAEAIWGKKLADHVADSFDWTVDWRASPANIAMLNHTLAFEHEIGQSDPETAAVRDRMALAIERHQTFVHAPSPPHETGPMPADPVKGRVFFLTDFACGSACLDFADIMLHLPHVTQVGLPTYADSVYMDISSVPLPSGLGRFGYGMKVYRHRVRGNNQWYTPRYRWPGGPMNSDEAIVTWIKSLH